MKSCSWSSSIAQWRSVVAMDSDAGKMSRRRKILFKMWPVNSPVRVRPNSLNGPESSHECLVQYRIYCLYKVAVADVYVSKGSRSLTLAPIGAQTGETGKFPPIMCLGETTRIM